MAKPTLVVALVMALWAAATLAAGQRVLLEVSVNGIPVGQIGEFEDDGQRLSIRPAEMVALGLHPPSGADPDTPLRLDGIPGLTYRLDRPKQAIDLMVDDARMMPRLLDARRGGPGAAPAGPAAESGIGLAIDYDLTASMTAGRGLAGGLAEARLFSPWGVLSTQTLGYATAVSGVYPLVRLDSAYVLADQQNLRRFRAGDLITAAPAWGRSVRLGGVQISSDYSLRPDLVTFPLPMIGATAAVPSVLDVVVNGAKVFSQDVQPGPFRMARLPIVAGAGTASLTMTDALGRQVDVTLPFYTSDRLLAEGLDSYSAEAGLIRTGWGLPSSSYQQWAGAGTYARGLTDQLTLGGHIEASGNLVMAGAGAVFNIAGRAVGTLAAAGSQGGGTQGALVAAGVQRIGQAVSFGLAGSVAGPGFRDIAALNGSPAARRQVAANLGLSLGEYGSFGLVYAEVFRDAAPAVERLFFVPANGLDGVGLPTASAVFQPPQRSRVLSATYSLQLGRVSVYVTGFYDFFNSGGSGVLLGLTVPLGGRSSSFTSAGASGGKPFGQTQVQQTATAPGEWGYRVGMGGGGGTTAPLNGYGEVQYQSQYGTASTGVAQYDRNGTIQAGARGSVALIERQVYASNIIADSFAVVDTGGMEGVRVTSENRPIGVTGTDGRLLVPNLLSYQTNRIALEPTDLPIDAQVAVTERKVSPQYRSGLVVRFPVRHGGAALLRLVDAAGRPLQVGSIARLAGHPGGLPVGYDGEVFAEDLEPIGNRLTVEMRGGGLCAASFDYQPDPGRIRRIGPLRCEELPP